MSTFETILLAAVQGRVREVLPDHLATTDRDGIWVGHFGRKKQLALLVANCAWSNEFHYQPRRYDVAFYRWSGSGFRLARQRRTSQRFSTPQAAVQQLGFQVQFELVRAIVPEFF